MVLVLGHFETQSWLIPTRSFSNPLSPRLRLDHRFLCCLQRIKVRNGRQHPRSRRVLRLILHLPALRLQFGQVSLLQRLAFAINHPPSQEPRVIPRARGDGESHAVHQRRRGWIHGRDSAGDTLAQLLSTLMSTCSAAEPRCLQATEDNDGLHVMNLSRP